MFRTMLVCNFKIYKPINVWKKQDFRNKHGFCMLPTLKEANIYNNLICFDRNFDHLHISVVTFVSENSSTSLEIFR